MKKQDYLTVGDLKKQLKDLDDDAIVTTVGYDDQGGSILQPVFKSDDSLSCSSITDYDLLKHYKGLKGQKKVVID